MLRLFFFFTMVCKVMLRIDSNFRLNVRQVDIRKGARERMSNVVRHAGTKVSYLLLLLTTTTTTTTMCVQRHVRACHVVGVKDYIHLVCDISLTETMILQPRRNTYIRKTHTHTHPLATTPNDCYVSRR